MTKYTVLGVTPNMPKATPSAIRVVKEGMKGLGRGR